MPQMGKAGKLFKSGKKLLEKAVQATENTEVTEMALVLARCAFLLVGGLGKVINALFYLCVLCALCG